MIKSVTLISIVITSVLLVTLVGVVYAYQGLTTSNTNSNPTVMPDPVSLPLLAASPTNVPDVSPQDAASIAAKFSSRTDLYSVELADFNGAQTYKVSFNTGDVIYVRDERSSTRLCAPTEWASAYLCFTGHLP